MLASAGTPAILQSGVLMANHKGGGYGGVQNPAHGPNSARKVFSQMHSVRKQHYSGECYDRGRAGEMDLKRLNSVYDAAQTVQPSTRGKKPHGMGA